MEELNRKIAEWCGWKPRINYNDPVTSEEHPPDFTTSLDACFEYIVPKLLRDGHDFALYNTSERFAVEILPEFDEAVESETPALALCLAVEKLIDGEMK